MPVIEDIVSIMRKLAPEETAEAWDNTGLIIGDESKLVKNVLIGLDCTEDCIRQAIEKKAELIITHHSVIFTAIKKINASTAIGRRVLNLIKNGIAVYSAHTNLDIAENGTNDTLFKLLQLKDKKPLIVDETAIGRIGIPYKEYTLKEFAEFMASILKTGGVSFVGEADKKVNKIGICTGSASSGKYMDAAASFNCDTFLTGDVSYHQAQYAGDLGLNIICAPHFSTEVLITHSLAEYLTKEAAALKLDVNFYVQENQRDIFNYI